MEMLYLAHGRSVRPLGVQEELHGVAERGFHRRWSDQRHRKLSRIDERCLHGCGACRRAVLIYRCSSPCRRRALPLRCRRAPYRRRFRHCDLGLEMSSADEKLHQVERGHAYRQRVHRGRSCGRARRVTGRRRNCNTARAHHNAPSKMQARAQDGQPRLPAHRMVNKVYRGAEPRGYARFRLR